MEMEYSIVAQFVSGDIYIGDMNRRKDDESNRE